MEWSLPLTMALLLTCVGIRAQRYNDTKTLLTTLFDTNGYNKNIRPVEYQGLPLPIYIEFHLNAIVDFNEQEESLTTAGYLKIFWLDKSLVWDPDHYNGLTRLYIPQDDIWKPDISLKNSFTTLEGLGSSYYKAWVFNGSLVHWKPSQVLKSTCVVDITYFPFDTQTCFLTFIAWSYTQFEILFVPESQVITDEYVESATWKLIETATETDDFSEASITYTLTLQRKPLYYVFNMILPVVLLSLLNIFIFILPVSSGERASYAVTVFLSLTVFMTIVASEFPKNSENTPLFAVYLVLMISISTTYVLLTVIQLRLASRNNEKHPVGRFYIMFYNIVQVVRCQRCNCRKTQVTDLTSSLSLDEQNHGIKWSDIVNALDVVFFCAGFLLTFLVTLTLVLMVVTQD